MKTHELAKALNLMAKILRSLPNQELSEFGDKVKSGKIKETSNVGVSLSTLAAFSNYSKSDWETIIKDYELPIAIRPRDAARDVMGKILGHLANNEEERKRIARKSQAQSNSPSELSNALNFLLSNG